MAAFGNDVAVGKASVIVSLANFVNGILETMFLYSMREH
jgi:hypothetical protein